MIDAAVSRIAPYDPGTDGDGSWRDIRRRIVARTGSTSAASSWGYGTLQGSQEFTHLGRRARKCGALPWAAVPVRVTPTGCPRRSVWPTGMDGKGGWATGIWVVEIVISAIKRVLGEALYSLKKEYQMHEALLRVYAYNRLVGLAEEAAVGGNDRPWAATTSDQYAHGDSVKSYRTDYHHAEFLKPNLLLSAHG